MLDLYLNGVDLRSHVAPLYVFFPNARDAGARLRGLEVFSNGTDYLMTQLIGFSVQVSAHTLPTPDV